MKIIKLIFITLLIMVGSSSAYASKPELLGTYEVTNGNTGVQGTYVITVTLIGKENKPSEGRMKRAAVHGVLFKGFANERMRQRPLAGSIANEAQHADFYKDFFAEGGMAENYASVVPGSRKVVKSGKEYRVSETLQVNKDALLKDLQSNGVIRGLNNGF